MEVVLTQDVDALGLRGEVVNVARGYARNFLLPRGLAHVANPGLKRELERREAQRARHEAKSVEEARTIASRLEALELRFDVTAGPRSEEHTSELQSRFDLVCRLLLEKKKNT